MKGMKRVLMPKEKRKQKEDKQGEWKKGMKIQRLMQKREQQKSKVKD